jgi:hypothetical protein
MIGLIGAVLSANAIIMLVSPKAWFRLPLWISAKGSLTEEEYANGSGRLQIRMMGATWLAFVAWVVCHSLIKEPLPRENKLILILSFAGWCTVALVGLHLAINAVFMLASPRAWLRLPVWLRARVPVNEQKCVSGLGGSLVRLTGAILLAVLGWVLYSSLPGELLKVH